VPFLRTILVVLMILPCFFAVQAGAASVDLSSPQAAAKTLHRAVEQGDAAAIRRVLHADTEAQKPLIDAFADLLTAGHRFAEAAQKQFGAAGAAMGADMTAADELKQIDAATVKPTGDNTATLTLPNQDRELSFIRTNGQWQLSVTAYAGATPQNLPRQLKLLHAVTKTLTDAAAALHAGQYPTPAAARQAIEARLQEIMIAAAQNAPPASPATRPATEELDGD
jgi:hypothetical protein